MTERPDLQQLFAHWRQQPLPSSKPPPRLDGKSLVQNALRDVKRRQQRRILGRRLGLLATAAALLLGVGATLWAGNKQLATRATPLDAPNPIAALSETQGEVSVTSANGAGRNAARELTEGDSVHTERGSATLGFPSGAAAHLAQRSSLRLTAMRSTEALLLTRGRVDVEVPKLDARRGFAVETPDAKVVVHGTGFSVSVDAASSGIRTRVDVTHGVVSVLHAGEEVRLTSGQHWPAEPPVATDATEPLPRADALPDVTPGKRKAQARGPSARQSRELAEQNGHFARAMSLKKQGRAKAALLELGHLLSSHPASPLAQETRVERLRILHGLGRRQQLQKEARQYLAEFPEGYAAAEAQTVLEEQP